MTRSRTLIQRRKQSSLYIDFCRQKFILPSSSFIQSSFSLTICKREILYSLQERAAILSRLSPFQGSGDVPSSFRRQLFLFPASDQEDRQQASQISIEWLWNGAWKDSHAEDSGCRVVDRWSFRQETSRKKFLLCSSNHHLHPSPIPSPHRLISQTTSNMDNYCYEGERAAHAVIRHLRRVELTC